MCSLGNGRVFKLNKHMLTVNTIPMTFLGSFVISQKFQVNLPFTNVYSMNKKEKLKLHLKKASGGTNLKGRFLLSASRADTHRTTEF